jgi:hypothetical protein
LKEESENLLKIMARDKEAYDVIDFEDRQTIATAMRDLDREMRLALALLECALERLDGYGDALPVPPWPGDYLFGYRTKAGA